MVNTEPKKTVIHISDIYRSIYRFWGDTTPLSGDCGALCNQACCESGSPDDEEAGMYLFPGEKALFLHDSNFKVVSSEFMYGDGKRADIVICKEPCERDMRPLSCRIFPLVPYYKNGVLTIIQDPRAGYMCPLAQKKAFAYLSPAFIRKTEKTFQLLTEFAEVRSFLAGLTDILDDYRKLNPTEVIV